VSIEFEAAAADSLAHLLKGKAKHAPAPGAVCANCGAVLQGQYCHVCGQNADTHQRSILHLIVEAVEGMFELDGRLLRTVPALFFRPGRLTRDYMEGRLARHVPPFRTFLVALVLFIFAAQHVTHVLTQQDAKKKATEAAVLATPQGRATAVAKRRAEAVKSLQDDTKEAAADRAETLKDKDVKPGKAQAAYDRSMTRAQARYARDMHRADRVAQGLPARSPEEDAANDKASKSSWSARERKAEDNPDYYWSVLFEWGHRIAVLLLPIVGLSLAMVYRKRREIFVYDHLLVAMNLLSFGFLLSAAGLLLPFSLMGWFFAGVAVWTLVNLFQTLRVGYGSSLLGAGLKTLLVWSITTFFAFVLMIGLFVLAVAEL
jgi:hypothetical protein